MPNASPVQRNQVPHSARGKSGERCFLSLCLPHRDEHSRQLRLVSKAAHKTFGTVVLREGVRRPHLACPTKQPVPKMRDIHIGSTRSLPETSKSYMAQRAMEQAILPGEGFHLGTGERPAGSVKTQVEQTTSHTKARSISWLKTNTKPSRPLYCVPLHTEKIVGLVSATD